MRRAVRKRNPIRNHFDVIREFCRSARWIGTRAASAPAGAIGAERALDGGTGANRRSKPGRRRTQCGHEIAVSAIPAESINRHLRTVRPLTTRNRVDYAAAYSLVGSIAEGCMAVLGQGRHSDHVRYTSADTPIADKAANPAEFSVGPVSGIRIESRLLVAAISAHEV